MQKNHVVICRIGKKSLKPPERGVPAMGQG